MTSNDDGPRLEDRKLWQKADSFAGLCELGAQFVEGRIGYQPSSCGASIDEESHEIRSYLAAFNRAGLLTNCSQPGREDQRAAVCGLALEPTAVAIERGLLKSDLLVIACQPGNDIEQNIVPITLDEGEPFTWVGYVAWEHMNQGYVEDCSVPALWNLGFAWSIEVVDLQWGRREHLWDSLAAILDEKELIARRRLTS